MIIWWSIADVKMIKKTRALSILPPPETINEMSNRSEVMFVWNGNVWPVTSKIISKWTIGNLITNKILKLVL